MITRTRTVFGATLVLTLAACASDPGPAKTTGPVSSTPGPSASTTVVLPSSTGHVEPAASFPVAAFAAIREDPTNAAFASKLQAGLAQLDVTGGGGMSATVMTPQGTWSGTTGTADGVRALQVDDQFSIASITKSVVAAQVMLMVEAGELALDDPVAEHLPAGLQFDTNRATIRQLLSHRSGLPDYYELGPLATLEADAQRVFSFSELLALVPADRMPPGTNFNYAETNYLLLKVMIEHVRGHALPEVVRDGALAIGGLERLVYQPAERPTEPMAMPAGTSTDVLERGGGYLPSLATASAYTASGAIASDSRSLARWWRAFCAGEIVSQASLTEMSIFQPAAYLGSYGLGLENPGHGYAEGIGNTGQLPGYMSWAGCLPEDEAVIVVLTNHEVEDGHLEWSHGLARPLVDALRAP